jgi:ferric-dicitrate binding protein FerR (iron transport regulator)
MYVYDIADGSEKVLDVDTALHTSWLDGFYVFDRESFAGVLTRLSIYYGVQVDCEPRAGEYVCSGQLNLNGGFDQVMAGLSYVVPITFTVEDGVYRIRLSD